MAHTVGDRLRGAVVEVAAPVVVYLSLHLAARFSPTSLWGANVVLYYPVWVWALLVLVPAGAAVAPFRFPPSLAALGRHRLFPWVLGVGSIPLLYILRVRSHSLGDSQKWFAVVQNAVRDLRPFSEVPGHNASLQIQGLEFINFQQALDLVVHVGTFAAGRAWLGWSPVDAYEWVSCLAGGLYLPLLWRLGGQLTTRLSHRAILTLFLASLGTIQLFFGYGESYTLVTLLTAGYISLAIDALRGLRSPWIPGALLVAAALTHMLAVSLAPSWIYLAWRDRRLGPLLRRRQVALPLAAAGAAAAVVCYLTLYQGLHLPLRADGPGRYGLLSLSHLVNLGNELLLVGPFGALWGVTSLLRRARATEETTFLGWAALGACGLIGVHDITMAGRDWDLMSFPTLPLSLWGIQSLRQRHGDPALPWVGRLVLPVMLLHTGLWVGVNLSGERAAARQEHLLMGPANQLAHYRHWVLGYFYMKQGDRYPEAVEALAAAIHAAPEDELNRPGTRAFAHRKAYATSLARSGRHAEALGVIREIYKLQEEPHLDGNDLAVHQEWGKITFTYAEKALTLGDTTAAVALWKEALVALTRTAEWTKQRQAFLNLSLVQERLGQHDQKQSSMARALGAQGWKLLLEQDPRSAIAPLREAFALHPSPGFLFNLGLAYLWAGEIDSANAVYERAVVRFGVDKGREARAPKNLDWIADRGIQASAARAIRSRFWGSP